MVDGAGLRHVEGTSSTTSVEVKSEPMSESDKEKQRVNDLLSNPQAVLRKFQDYIMDSKIIATRAEDASGNVPKYAAAVIQDNSAHMQKLMKATKMLERICTEKANEQELPKVVKMIDVLTHEHRDLEKWAEKFGIRGRMRGDTSKRRKKS